jgi:hypothetical protein
MSVKSGGQSELVNDTGLAWNRSGNEPIGAHEVGVIAG